MPGDNPFLTAFGRDEILIVFNRIDLAGHQPVINGSSPVPYALRYKAIKPILADDPLLLISKDLAPFPVDEGHLTFGVKGDLHWRMSDRWRLIAGYKYMDVDYSKGEGVLGREVYKMKHSGPEFAVAFSW